MMSSAYYELYLKKVFDLAGTMIIKSEDTALAINEHLRLMGVSVDLNNPHTWKYYLNLSGQYHSTDKPMFVTSIDTLEVIPFTRESLRQHRATQREYDFHSRYYRELIERNPDQELLIRGILNPVNLNDAITADDHTILYYDKKLVEGNEANFIENLQEFIHRFFHRWDVPDYRITDPWFVPAQLGILYAMLPKAILNIRLANCRTDYAHSYHIRQYLASFGKLDPYFDFMTPKQRLFFYRNLNYINSNNGKQETFHWLTDKVMTDRLFPLSEYILQQKDTNIPIDLKPEVEFERVMVNGLEEPLGSDIKTVKDLLEMELPKAKGNLEHLPEALIETTELTAVSKTTKHRTKVLESSVIDLTDAEPFTLTEVLLYHWPYFANIGRYRSVFTVNNPVTNSAMLVNVRDAWLLYLYAYNKARGVTLDLIPVFDVKRVIRIPAPTRDELKSLVNPEHVPDAFIDEALGLYPPLEQYASIEAFTEACVKIHRNMMAHRDLAVYQHHYLTRGQVEMMVDRFYMDYKIENNLSNTPYSVWLRDNNYRIDELGAEELDILALELFQGATGQKAKTTKTLKEVHEAMCKLMEHLSSYSIQIIPTINSGYLKILDWSYLRYGDWKTWTGDFMESPLPVVLPLKDWTHLRDRAFRRLGERYANGYKSSTRRNEFLELKLVSSNFVKSSALHQRKLPVATVTSYEESTIELGELLTGQRIVFQSTEYSDESLARLPSMTATMHVLSQQVGKGITPAHVELIPLNENPDGSMEVSVVSIGDAGTLFHNRYKGKGTVVLERRSLNSFGTLEVRETLPLTTERLMALMSIQLGFTLESEDYVLETIRNNVYLLKAKSKSLRWFGEIEINVVEPIELGLAIAHDQMDGFNAV